MSHNSKVFHAPSSISTLGSGPPATRRTAMRLLFGPGLETKRSAAEGLAADLRQGRFAMRIIAIINQKGGCGKTTTGINLAACLARLGQKTLLVDVDPQGHCGVGLAVPEDQIERTIYDAMLEERDGKVAKLNEIVWQIASDFDLAPSNIKLAGFEQVFAGRPGREDRLSQALEQVRGTYEWCII